MLKYYHVERLNNNNNIHRIIDDNNNAIITIINYLFFKQLITIDLNPIRIKKKNIHNITIIFYV